MGAVSGGGCPVSLGGDGTRSRPRRVRVRITGRRVTSRCHWWRVGSSCGTVVVAEQPAEPLAALHLAGREGEDRRLVTVSVRAWDVAASLVETLLVGVPEAILEDVPGVPLLAHDEVVELLGPHSPEPLRVGVQVRGLQRQPLRL